LEDTKLLFKLQRFANDEDGEITVDWVVLVAAIFGLGLIVMSAIWPVFDELEPPEEEAKD
jgi:hypothetical protein